MAKRKINRVGQNTLTVSIPAAWAKKNNLKPGDEIEVEEEEKRLVISRGYKKQESYMKIDLTNLGRMINRTIAAIYKAGYERVTLKYSTSEELKTIQETIDRSCHVYEIMSIEKDKVEIKTIGELDPADFDNIFRKIGFAVTEIAKDTLEALKTSDEKIINSTILKDKIVDRHTDFCRRIINKGHQIKYKKTHPLYLIIDESEILADIFKTICKDIQKQKLKAEDDLIELQKKIIKLIEIFYETLYNFNHKKIKELGKSEKEIKETINKICNKPRKNSKLIYHLGNAFETAFEMKGALLTLHMGEQGKK